MHLKFQSKVSKKHCFGIYKKNLVPYQKMSSSSTRWSFFLRCYIRVSVITFANSNKLCLWASYSSVVQVFPHPDGGPKTGGFPLLYRLKALWGTFVILACPDLLMTLTLHKADLFILQISRVETYQFCKILYTKGLSHKTSEKRGRGEREYCCSHLFLFSPAIETNKWVCKSS